MAEMSLTILCKVEKQFCLEFTTWETIIFVFSKRSQNASIIPYKARQASRERLRDSHFHFLQADDNDSEEEEEEIEVHNSDEEEEEQDDPKGENFK